MKRFLIKPTKTSNNNKTIGSSHHTTDNNTKNCGNQSKKKYSQKFRNVWKEEFTWVGDQDGKPFCQVCNMYLVANHAHLQRHGSSLKHKSAENILKNQPKLDDKKNEFEAKRNKLKIAELRILMFILQHNLPFVLIGSLIALIKAVAVDSSLVKDLQMERTKATETTCTLFLNEANSLMSNILKNQKFSIVIDETTDISTTKCLTIIARYYDFNMRKVRDRFLALIGLKTSDATSIFEAISNLFKDLKIPFENLVGFASDNASVMTGNFKGVRTLISKRNPHIYSIGCICHSLHLLSSAAAKSIPQKIEILARNIYFYFSHSSKRQEQLKEFQENFNIKIHKILKLSGTRWLSLENVINRIVEQWDPLRHYFLMTTFENESNADLAHKIRSELNDENKFYMIFLSYVLNLTNSLNVLFQSESPQIHNLLKTLTSFYKTILSNFIKREFIADDKFRNIDFHNSMYFKNVEDVYIGPKAELFLKKMNFSRKHIIELKKTCINYYTVLCLQFKERINLFDRQLLALQDIDPSNLGESAITIISEFPNLIRESEVDVVDSEWRSVVNQSFISRNLDCPSFWAKVFDMKNCLNEIMYPNLTKLVSALLCLPHSSASAERTFSQLKLIKDAKRNALNVPTINAILASKEIVDGVSSDKWKPSEYLIKNYRKN